MATYPSTQFSTSKPMSNAPSYMSESQNLKIIAVSTGAQRWEFKLKTAWLKIPEARALWAFLNALAGQSKTFEIELPIHSMPIGNVSGAVQASAAYSVGDNSITFANFTPAAGDFFRFANHNKVYQVESAAGNVATVYPPLLNAVSNNENVTVNNVLFTVRLKSDVTEMSLTSRSKTRLEFDCVEAL